MAQRMAVTASIGQKAKCSWTMSGCPATWSRLTCPSHSRGTQKLDHSGLSCPEAATP